MKNKTNSQASPLGASSPRKEKKQEKQKTLGQVAYEAYLKKGRLGWCLYGWKDHEASYKENWEATAQAVANEIIRRVEAKYGK